MLCKIFNQDALVSARYVVESAIYFRKQLAVLAMERAVGTSGLASCLIADGEGACRFAHDSLRSIRVQGGSAMVQIIGRTLGYPADPLGRITL